MSFQPVGIEANSATELEQFKVDINLAEFACNRFGYTVDEKQSSPNSIVLRKGDDEKVIVARDLDGHYVYFAPITPFATDYGSIIDFIQVRMRVTLGQVRVLLREYQGTNYPSLTTQTLVAKIQPVTKSTLSVLKAYESFNQLSYSTYLDSRGLKKELYTSRRFAGKIRVDGKGNLIFPHFRKFSIGKIHSSASQSPYIFSDLWQFIAASLPLAQIGTFFFPTALVFIQFGGHLNVTYNRIDSRYSR